MRNNYILLGFFIIFINSSYSQVGIGTTTPNGALDVNSSLPLPSTHKAGLLPPIVALTATNSFATTTLGSDVINPNGGGNPLTGTIVYNTNTSVAGANQVTPGYYFYNGTIWEKITSGAMTNWSLTGNAGTSSTTNFIGTSDAVDFVTRTSNLERMRINATGQVSVNSTTPFSNSTFYSLASENNTAIDGIASGTSSAIYGQNTGAGDAVVGVTNNIGNGTVGISFGTGNGMYAENFNGTGYSIFALDGPVFSDNTFFGLEAFEGVTDSPTSNAFWGRNNDATGTAILGGVNGVNVYSAGSGVSGSGSRLGIFGYAGDGLRINANRGNAAGRFTLDSDSDPTTNGSNATANRASSILAGFNNIAYTDSSGGTGAAQDSYFGGYFSGGNENGTPSYAYAGLRYNTNAAGTTGTDFKIVGPGSNSTIIMDETNTPRILFSPEAPEIVFQDFGVGKLMNGKADILLDPILKRSLQIDESHPLKVYVTLEGECNGVFVTNKSSNGFTVKELQNGTSNVEFSWQIVANRADTKDGNGVITSKHIDVRLPIGPGPLTNNAKSKPNDSPIKKNQQKNSSKYNIKEVQKIKE